MHIWQAWVGGNMQEVRGNTMHSGRENRRPPAFLVGACAREGKGAGAPGALEAELSARHVDTIRGRFLCWHASSLRCTERRCNVES
jgi:hypothetical protein